jgi:hypothetical protein
VRGRALALAALALAACGRDAPEPRWAPPVRARASLVLEPPVLALGEVAQLTVAVVTPPGQTPRPYVAPAEVPGFWLLDTRRLEVEEQPGRWVHRTRVRLRARAVGRFEYPGGEVEVDAPGAPPQRVALDPLPIEVVSALEAHPHQQTPFGVRRPDLGPVDARGSTVAFGAGAALALAVVGLVGLARRRARQWAQAPPSAPPAAPPGRTARTALAAARELAAADAVAALDATARALRRYAAARFGGDTVARTREELAAAEPPFLMTTRWGPFLELLDRIDALRFPPPRGAEARAAASALVDEASAFVERSLPLEEREPAPGSAGEPDASDR